MRWGLALVVLGSCGRIAFDPRDDAGGDSGVQSVFTNVALPDGGLADGVVIGAAPGEAYAWFQTRGIFRTTDYGMTWTECAHAFTRDVHVAPGGTVYYAQSGDDVFESTDNCATWQSLGFAEEANALAFFGGELLVGADSGLHAYNGSTWRFVTTPLDGQSIRAIATHQLVLMIGSLSGGVARSFDGGTVWTVQNQGLNHLNIAELDIAPSNGLRAYARERSAVGFAPGLFRTDDAGANWMLISAAAGDGVAVDPTNPDRILFAQFPELTESTNAGGAFNSVATAEMGNSLPSDVAFDDAGGAYVASARGLFHRTGNGAFVPSHAGINAWTLHENAMVGNAVYFASQGGLFRSNDGGRTYSLSTSTMSLGASCLDVHIPQNDPALVVTSANLIRQSSDGGQTFSLVWDPGGGNGNVAESLATNGTRLFAATATRVAYADAPWAGATWTSVQLGGMDRELQTVHVRPNGNVVGVTDELGVWESTNNGVSYQQLVGAPISAREAWSAPDGRLLLGTNDGLWSPQGTSWVTYGPAGEYVPDLLIAGNTWIVATNSGVMFTKDEGATWLPLPGLEAKLPFALARDADGNLLVGTRGWGLFRTPMP